MNNQEILAKLKLIVTPYVQNKDAYDHLNEETDFISDLNINSANLVDVILDVEEEFGIVIDNESMEKMVNVKATMEVIHEKLDQK